jgi:hypothetical protein
MLGKLTPQQRIRLAQDLRRRANGQPGLTAKQRQELRRHAFNLMQLNLVQAKLQKAKEQS